MKERILKINLMLLLLLIATFSFGQPYPKKPTTTSKATKIDTLGVKRIYFTDSSYMISAKGEIAGASSYLDPVISFSTQASAIDSIGKRYIASANGTTWVKDHIYEYNGADWDSIIPTSGQATLVGDSGSWFLYTTLWTKQSSPSTWATSGINAFNTNSGKILINKTIPTEGSGYKLEIVGSIYSSASSRFGGWGYGSSKYGMWRGEVDMGSIRFNTFTTNSYSLDFYSGNTFGGRQRWFTKGLERMSLDSNGYFKIGSVKYPKATGSSGQVLMKSATDSAYWGTASAGGSSASINQILVKRLAKADTIITSIDLIANNTLFPDADSVQFYLYGNFTATVNLFNNYTKVYAGDAIITRTSANAGRLIDRNTTANGYMWWDGGNITSYAECYRTVANCKDRFQPKYAVSTNSYCAYAINSTGVIIGKIGGTIKSTGESALLIMGLIDSYVYGSYISTNAYAILDINTGASANNYYDIDELNNSTVNQTTFYCNEANGIKYFKAKSIVAKVGYTALYLKNSTKGIYVNYVDGIINNGSAAQLSSVFNIGKWGNAGGVSVSGYIVNCPNINMSDANFFTATAGAVYVFNGGGGEFNIIRTSQNNYIFDISGSAITNVFKINNYDFNVTANDRWIFGTQTTFKNCNINYIGSPTNFSNAWVRGGKLSFFNCQFTNTQSSAGTNNGMFYGTGANGDLTLINCQFKNSINSASAHFINLIAGDDVVIANCIFEATNTSSNVVNGGVNLWMYGNSYTNVTTVSATAPIMKTTLNSGVWGNEATNIY